ncbi:two-partner secretion domain-containing protein [Mastigocoleus testarum]|uniref:Filamentous haemagglutinin FhaB/tRNA nuclease CdiA-like TPS domain-containing protein n=1 Tax=Mastigocoleus testarum BC008 TaxID=371196 RepID=A0A0V7ZN05_9CYAN|nr:filamentous hemagglutinin N-terminal domain-containing protein [Mastigocoleus testarum]KST65762.1 hypothetical protein BC008_22555 [Mastigocoleus testarum BC008]
MHNRHFALWGLSLILSLASVVKTQAQLIPDNTLGEENSVVTPVNSLKNRIDGGAIRGSNLFHSFKEFNIDDGQSVYFDNPGAVANILTRVTGRNSSSILGKLGVLGNANLFLINPNGIIFGQNASLDISGSFTASTTPNILFDNGWKFSATNSQAPPLLEINLTPGLQYPSNQVHHIQNPLGQDLSQDVNQDTINPNITQGDITNQGNLSVGKDLNLIGRNLNLTGKLDAGRDLKLQASNTLQIRDNLTKPFIASAGNNLLLQGNQSLDIFALNHPDSGLFSGRDLVLKSSAAVLGDAHYFSGGNFKIEQLDGKSGDLESPKDPIIRASGDVSFDSYTGASLHILAGGSVNITGDVTITGADGANGLEETVTLSNGENLEINGKTQPTLDIRAGTTAFGTPGVTGSGGFIPSNPSTGGSPSSSNIVIGGNIKVDSPDGLVFLTNQYNSDSNLSGGNIQLQGDIDTSRDFGNAGDILIDSASELIISNGAEISTTTEGNGQGGDIQLIANDSVAITNSSLLVSSRGLGDAGNISIETGKLTVEGITDAAVISANNDNVGRGGDITLNASESIDMTGSSVLIFTNSTGAGDAGNLNIDTKQLILDDGVTVFSNTDVGGGKGGNININATDSVQLLNGSVLYTKSIGSGEPGDINLTTGQLIIENGAEISSGSITSTAGNINLLDLKSLQLNQNSQISASTVDGEAGDIIINATDSINLLNASGVTSEATGSGTAGELNITTGQFNITDASRASVNSKEIAGDLTVTANSIILDNQAKLTSETDTGVSGNIALQDLKSLQIKGNSLLSATTRNGEAGDITINASDEVTVENNSTIASGALGKGEAGFLSIITDLLTISNNSQATVSSIETGNAGEISIQAADVSLNNLGTISAQTSSGTGGNIILKNLKTLSLSGGSSINATTGGGTAGNIEINATDSIQLENASQLISEALGDGTAGNMKITTGQLTLSDLSQANVSSKGNGSAGSVSIDASDVLLTNQSQIAATTTESGTDGHITLDNLNSLELLNSQISASTINGEAGDIDINAKDSVNISDNSKIISEAIGSGIAGELTINTNQFTMTDNSQANLSSKGNGSAGSILINAGDVNLANQAEISATTESGIGGDIKLENLATLSLSENSSINANTTDGEAGNIEITTTDSIQVENGSKLASESIGNGTAGNITISTNQFVITDNSQANVSSKANGSAGSVFINASDVYLFNQSQIAATTAESGTDGNISLNNLNSLELSNSKISASTMNGEAGDINISATDLVKLSDNSSIASEATSEGKAGELAIATNQLTITNSQANVSSKGAGSAGSVFISANDVNLASQAEISATTESGIGGDIRLENLATLSLSENSSISANTTDGEAGNIEISTTDLIQVENSSRLASESIGDGIAGYITITTNQFRMTDNSQANVSSKGNGSAGSILINASDIFLSNQAEIAAKTTESGTDGNITLNNLNSLELFSSLISASTINGEAGDININATDSVKLSDSSSIASEAKGSGIAGELTIITNQLTMNNSQANVSSQGDGSAGRIYIDATDVNLSQNAKIFATTESGIGGTESSIDDIDGIGAILLNSLNSLSVNNSEISASTENGEAGYININAANSVELIGEGGLSVQASQGGIAGSITVNTNQFTIGDEAKVTVSSPSGQAGNLEITANDLFLDRGRLTAETGIGESAEGANITLTIQDLLRMDNESLISAEAFGTANGGNITINNPEGFVIGLSFENSDISANANEGNGGNIDITTHNIFGLIFREQKTSESDITASSKFGVNGQVTVNQLNVDPSSGLLELPSNLEGTTKIKSGCAAAQGNNFIVSGKGGLPQSPDDLFTGKTTNTELFDLVPNDSQISSNISASNRNINAEEQKNQVPKQNQVLEKNKILEATGLVFDADGNVELVARIPEFNSHHSGIYSVSCKNFSAVSK